MKIDKNYFKSETKISRSDRVASVWAWWGRGLFIFVVFSL